MPIWEELPDLRKDAYKPLYIQLSETLAEYIRGKRLQAGTTLPSEQILMEKYKISRTTARLAMQRLQNERMAYKVQGKGTFVSAPKRRKFVRCSQNMESALAEQGIKVVNRLVEYTQGPAPQWAKGLSVPVDTQFQLIERLKMAKGKPLALEKRAIPIDISSRLSAADLKEKSIFELFDPYPDIRIVQVTYSITGAVASEREALQLRVSDGAPVLIRSGLYYSRDQRLVMASRIVFVANRVELRYEFNVDDDNWGIVRVV